MILAIHGHCTARLLLPHYRSRTPGTVWHFIEGLTLLWDGHGLVAPRRLGIFTTARSLLGILEALVRAPEGVPLRQVGGACPLPSLGVFLAFGLPMAEWLVIAGLLGAFHSLTSVAIQVFVGAGVQVNVVTPLVGSQTHLAALASIAFCLK